MLGNFSFGDYFKEEAIAYAWELLTKVYALARRAPRHHGLRGRRRRPGRRRGARDLAQGHGLRRRRGSSALGLPGDNFWQMGETGPCGPCTEIHWFNGDAAGGVPYESFGDEPTPDGLGWTEIWNLVFMQFERSLDPSGEATLAALPKPCVDTGAGLERMASVLQGVTSNYDTDAPARARRRRRATSAASATPARRETTTSRCASSPITRGRRRSSSPRASSRTAPGASTCCVG